MTISNSAIIILGASGDLAKRKLMPSIAGLFKSKDIDNSCVIIGSGRTPFTTEEFRTRFNDLSTNFTDLLYYHQGLKGIKEFIMSKGNFSQIVIFMALPPVVFDKTAAALADEGFSDEMRLIIEKPFGYNHETAKNINLNLLKYFKEKQIYRIDHYLAKEAVQNILVFRFANSLFYPIWNSKYIRSIQINAYEDIGVEDRGAYFDSSGIIRDMVQNHLLQLLSLITMETPVTLDAEDIRIQKISVLKAIEFDECHRYQYKGYLDEKGVSKDSTTETYAELKLHINNFRWNGMPIYIKVGKALNRKGTEVGFKFKRLPRLLFNKDNTIAPNRIIFKIQPAQGIIVDISSKIPGSELNIANTDMTFCYRDHFKDPALSAYSKLILDTLKGDRTLFVSKDEIELSWKKLDPFLDKGELAHYEPGSIPVSTFNEEWIDFEKYKSVCE